ncbi:PTS sugar transporter subunit IIB [Vagococcus acidifermentans]|uniref:PTS mannose/fructose/sorbose transporter subunit IIB n=1 Tax=Vagococcus acidifermentans TaxID=564710 RepID=A0A430B2V7_9ENTE|nr:PTS sugar transporter subunit IIB [Vagococcus acidifermentans]RSU14639.1 PTS mannose/fructose/sorbose transporter subunit IIB [Vagococcus acidifermentans]
MGSIVLARIDDRLIHGQVMTAWLQYTGGNHIVIVDEPTAADEFTKSIISMAVPSGIDLTIAGVEEGTEVLKNLPANDRVIILTKGPETYLQLIENGVPLEKIIIGGMGANKNRSKFYKNISASEEEKEIFRKIIEHGCELEVHIIPDEKAVSVKGIL